MVKIEATEHLAGFQLVGRLGKAYEYGEAIFGESYYGEEETTKFKNEYGAGEYGDIFYGQTNNIWGLYQRRHSNGKQTISRLKFYTPTNPKTASQQSWRSNFTAGMTAWGNLTNEQKAVYNERAKAKHLHGVNLYLREYLKSV